MNTLISIIIPAYNVGELIKSTVDSVLKQSYDNLEIIIVDDGSTDDTPFILDDLSKVDARIKVYHKKNGGVTSARLYGVSRAQGEWIGFVDGDDYIEPQMYEKLLQNALKYNADISHCGYQMVFPSRTDYYYNTGNIICQNTSEALIDLIKGRVFEPTLCNKIYKKYLIDEMLSLNLLDVSIKINEDLLMNYWIFKKADKSVYEDFCPYHYIVRKGSAANSKLNIYHLNDPLKVTRIMMDDCAEELKNTIFGKYVNQLSNCSTLSSKGNKELIVPFRKKVRKELRCILLSALKAPIGKKTKIKALWAAIWPWSYTFVHDIYGKLTGTAHKYDID